MSNSISDPNVENSILDAATKLKENTNYIMKFGLFLSVTQHINSRLIFYDVHINKPTIALDIKLNLYTLHGFESYQIR